MTSLPNPKFSQHRLALTKVIAFVYLIDDIFDLKGSLDELRLFTDAINKWEVSAIDLLPCYMRKCYDALYKTTNEIAEMIFEEHGWNPINILKKSWIELSDAFMREAMWFARGHLPPADDYLRNGVISCGVPLVLTHLNFLLGGGAMDSAESYPNLITSPATILRLWDDLGSAKDEKQEGFDGSYLECFMKENPQCSVESAREHVMQMICKAWEELNKESFSSSSFSQDFVTACLNTARMVKLMYSYNEEHKLPMLEEYVTLLLFKAPNLKA
ncbi:probable terpene synthase 13 [Musa acuminata AAA Group]|uniref:probable terpene synthase 13 n=1 Tax=Musa acuminata AAA Group TaxID=214697 RepID=UPI0031DD612B